MTVAAAMLATAAACEASGLWAVVQRGRCSYSDVQSDAAEESAASQWTFLISVSQGHSLLCTEGDDLAARVSP